MLGEELVNSCTNASYQILALGENFILKYNAAIAENITENEKFAEIEK